MKVYLAANFEQKDAIKQVAASMEMLGHEVTGTWFHEQGNDPVPALSRYFAERDVYEIGQADVLIVDTTMPTTRGGREVELGIQLGSGRSFWLVGPTRNVFHTLAHKSFASWGEAIGYLSNGRS